MFTISGRRSGIFALCRAALGVLAAASACSSAQAYAEFGYYAGAWAATNSGNCVGVGSNPYGGCTPLTFPLAVAQIQQTDSAGRFASASADLSLGRLAASTVIPNNENGSGAAANFMDTITIVGNLLAPVEVSFTMRVDSMFVIGNDAGQYDVQASLITGAGVVASYIRTTPGGNCYWAIVGGAECSASTGADTHSITRSVIVTDANRTFMLGASLFAGGWSMDNDASLQLSLQLPAGLSYTSASGVLPAAAVPEPQAWLLLLPGLAVAGAARRRRQRGSLPFQRP